MTLRDYLMESGLFLEGTEMLPLSSVVNPYCGFNVTKTDKEPIDQLIPFILAKRTQEWNINQFSKSGIFVAFIAGLFEVLNSETPESIQQIISQNAPKEILKKKLFEKIAKEFRLEQKILLTKDIWLDERYWDILLSQLNSGDFTRGLLIIDTLKFYNSKEQLMQTIKLKELSGDIVKLPLTVLKQIGNWPAPILYTPAEVTEGLYLKKFLEVNYKLGQAQERVYDKYLIKEMSVIRYRQPADLLSKKGKTEVVTPYIDKDKQKQELRIYFSDTKEAIEEKLSKIPTEEYIFVTDEKYGEILNPIVEKTILAIETQRARFNMPTIIGKIQFKDGKELIDALSMGKITVAELKDNLPSLLEESVLALGGNV